MTRIQISKFVCICFLPLVLLILIFYFSLSSVLNHHKHHHNLICSTYEFIIVAKSSRVAVFVTCNVIIITIFLGSSKSPIEGDSDPLFSLSPSVIHVTEGAIEKENDGDFDTGDHDEEEEFHGYDGYDEDNDDDVNAEDVDSEEEEDVDSEEEEDDEIDSSDLQMKVEEFIDKVYKKWKEEIIAERLLCIAATEFN
ncbi:hypothetical protein Dsin_026306 [Dipteronia sinensis]|uniref:Transmembrane protein n=1 Tax=Dipteronia sinensis TaxID=43782 RepID=A0AAD9ZXP4_9ROSI|nr:hypothetical protein Dsin_026306 [Dipteronia sinensis]